MPLCCTSPNRIRLTAGHYSSIALATYKCAVTLLGGTCMDCPAGLKLCGSGGRPKSLNLHRRNRHAVWNPLVSGHRPDVSRSTPPPWTRTVLALWPTYCTSTAIVDNSPRKHDNMISIEPWHLTRVPLTNEYQMNLHSNVLFEVQIFELCLTSLCESIG